MRNERQPYESIGNRIRELRGTRTQAAFASELGVTRGHYSVVEIGQQKPSRDFLLALQRVTRCSIDYVLTGEGEPLQGSIDSMAYRTRHGLPTEDLEREPRRKGRPPKVLSQEREPIALDQVAIGQRVRECRGDNAQGPFAHKLDLLRTELESIESGHVLPTREAMLALSHLTGCSVYWVLTGLGPPQGALDDETYRAMAALPFRHEQEAKRQRELADIAQAYDPRALTDILGLPPRTTRQIVGDRVQRLEDSGAKTHKTPKEAPAPGASRWGYRDLDQRWEQIAQAKKDEGIHNTNLWRLITEERLYNRVGGLQGWQIELLREWLAMDGDKPVEDYEAAAKFAAAMQRLRKQRQSEQ